MKQESLPMEIGGLKAIAAACLLAAAGAARSADAPMQGEASIDERAGRTAANRQASDMPPAPPPPQLTLPNAPAPAAGSGADTLPTPWPVLSTADRRPVSLFAQIGESPYLAPYP
ncbi:MAG: hypothetical protein M3Z16_00590, partial [Pseudomonadota bacterium]|nr:hypothetical protein [Pseudomonadota bacterium]